MSQLGYMFLAVGLGVFSFGMFHLMTHAFFKALLFLSAGSVIHGLNGEQDIRKMGGLRHTMPLTHITFLVGAVCLAGVPLTSGFFSKEAIIMSSWHSEMGNFVFWGMAVLAAGMTGFYIFRVYFYTFIGKSRSPEIHSHESPIIMAAPLMILAFFALVMGFSAHWVDQFLGPVFGATAHHYEDAALETVAVLAGLGGILTAGVVYMTSKDKLEFAKQALAPVYDVLFNKYYIDEIYDFLIVKPVRAIGAFLEQKVEKEGVDFVVDEVGSQVREVSRGISFWQSGNVRTYALNMLVGLVTILMFVVFL